MSSPPILRQALGIARPRVAGALGWAMALIWMAGAARLAAQNTATPQRPSFTTDASVTSPGSVEIEVGGAAFDGSFSLPATIKLTPEIADGPFSNMEWSVGFDGLIREKLSSSRQRVAFGERVTLAARRAMMRRGDFSVAVAPQVTFFRAGGNGVRAGVLAIAVQQVGNYSIIGNLTWSAASDPSDGNPAHQVDWATGLARSFGKASVFAEALYADPSGAGGVASLMQGVSVTLRPDLVIDFALQQSAINQRAQLGALVGMTVNLGNW